MIKTNELRGIIAKNGLSQSDVAIKKYDEMLHKDWKAASVEQKARLELIRAQTARISLEPAGTEEDGVEIINDCQEKAGANIGNHYTEVPEDI